MTKFVALVIADALLGFIFFAQDVYIGITHLFGVLGGAFHLAG